jgi:hypothetical protein
MIFASDPIERNAQLRQAAIEHVNRLVSPSALPGAGAQEKPRGGEVVQTSMILTTTTQEPCSMIHNRMPDPGAPRFGAVQPSGGAHGREGGGRVYDAVPMSDSDRLKLSRTQLSNFLRVMPIQHFDRCSHVVGNCFKICRPCLNFLRSVGVSY